MTQSKEKFDYKEWAKKTGYFKKYYAEHKCEYQERKRRYECSEKGKETRKRIESRPERKEARKINEANRRISNKLEKDADVVMLVIKAKEKQWKEKLESKA